ncbi:MAG TPA: outer membrane protein assembly factor BamD [Bryobacteraceae bacterium]|jgi:outer membrane protein assembly factor BamD|nr:outer membrane protein assembly factor BamD [Bryobacteraceae bacterium]
MIIRFSRLSFTVIAVSALLATSACGFKRKKYENPITKDTQQPDKLLYDKSVHDIEKGRYELARLTLNTLINTYDTSEYLAKAKLAIADSWYREGGVHGMAQAEAEYKDFILFYPAMEEAAESQKRICDIHIGLMEKADRDPNNALRAEYECKQLITQFPNSKFVPETEQKLRNIQEDLAEAEVFVGDYYHHKGANAAAANRLGGVVDQYPLFSRADFALWEEADSYRKMGKLAREKEGDALQRIVRDYPLSVYVEPAKKRLRELEMAIPEADPKAVARMKWEQENRTKVGLLSKSTEFLKRGPDVNNAAKSGSPTMTNPKQTVPLSVPIPASTAATNMPAATGVNDVTIAPVAAGAGSPLDTKPDARTSLKTDPTAPATPAAADPNAPATPAATTPATAKPDAAATPDASKGKKKNKKKTDKTTKTDTTKTTSQE